MNDSLNAGWALTYGAGLAWQFALSVQTSITDVESGFAADDYGACLESCAVALRAVFYCYQIADGYDGSPTTVEHHAAIAVSDHPVAAIIRSLPVPAGATRSSARQSMRTVMAEADRLRSRLPFEVPVLRSEAGYVPFIEISRDIERLRSEHGIGEIDWSAWKL